MRNSSRIFIASAFFWILPDFGGKNVKFEPNFHRQWNFWILPDFKCLQLREGQECDIWAEFSSRVHFFDLPNFGVQKCEIWAKFSSVVEFLDFAGFQVFACPGSARMRYSSRIFIASSFSGFCPILGAKMWNLTQIFIGSGISGFCRDFKCLQLREGQECDIWAEFSSRVHFLDFAQFLVKKCEIWAKFSSAVEFLDFARISSVCRSGRCKNAKFEKNFHRECIFLILPNFGGKNVKFELNFHANFHRQCENVAEFSSREHFLDFTGIWGQRYEIWGKFSSAVEFLDFAGFQELTAPGGARMRNSSRISIASAFSGFCPILGAKMWNLSQIFIASLISGFCRISSVLQVSEVQECEIRAEFSSRVHFLDFAQFWGQKCGICAKFSSAVEFLDFAGFQVFTGQWGARMRNSSRIFIASAFSGFCPILGAKMWTFEPNFHRQWNFWILPDFKCLQLRKVQECENVAEFSSREQFLDFTRFCL